MKKKSKTGRAILIFLILIIIGGGWLLFGPSVSAPESKYFYIATGSDFSTVKHELVKHRILSNTFIFDELAKYSKYDRNVKPGRYKINNGMSVFNLLRMLRSGRQSPVNLQIVKLRTKEELARKIGENFECDSLATITFLQSNDSLKKFGLDSNTAMTAVIPDKYVFQWNNTPGKIFRKFISYKKLFWNPDRRQKAAAHNLTESEAYILASIVEEETNKQDDKGKIASVYINRMNRNMKLAADPTIKFAMRDFGLKRIYYKYLNTESPYNTYLHTGLPPGPICTPSIKTIDAVLESPTTDYLFFVAKPDFSGYSNFASSFAAHDKYAKEYQKALDSLIIARGSNKTAEP